MSRQTAFAEASATPYLGGRQVRTFAPAVLPLGLMAITVSATLAMVTFASTDPLPLVGAAVALPALVVVVARWGAAVARSYNLAVANLQRGELDEAARRLQLFLGQPRPDFLATAALHILGSVALRRRDVASAVRLFAAAFEGSDVRSLRAAGGGIRVGAQVDLVLALVAAGNVHGAEAVLAQRTPEGALAAHVARLPLAHALVGFKRERYADVLDVLAAKERSLKGVLGAHEAAVAAIIEKIATERIGELAPLPLFASALPEDDEARAFVEMVLGEVSGRAAPSVASEERWP